MSNGIPITEDSATARKVIRVYLTQVFEAIDGWADAGTFASYRTMPISLAASSQTQIGSSPFSNFRQRLSQSIMGTKQVKVEETD